MKKLLIVFPDIHLAYSPTTLNLFYELQTSFDVELIANEPLEDYSSQKVIDPRIKYFKINPETGSAPSIKNLLRKIKNRVLPPSEAAQLKEQLTTKKCRFLIDYISEFDGEVIAVDFVALWCSQQTNKQAHLLSLEIVENDLYRASCDPSKIKSVIVQSEERFNYLFQDYKPKRFIVQNAPPNVQFNPDIAQRKPNQLIFCGSAVPEFGLFSCLDFIKDFPEYVLTVKGAVPRVTRETIDAFYGDLLNDERLIIDSRYLSASDLTSFVSGFRIGFAFYDFYRFDEYRTFNYYSVPSGKLFQYLNSGVPVIANKLPAFDMIENKKIGKTISYLSSIKIKESIDSIEATYTEFALNAKKTAIEFNFSDNIQEFKTYLRECL